MIFDGGDGGGDGGRRRVLRGETDRARAARHLRARAQRPERPKRKRPTFLPQERLTRNDLAVEDPSEAWVIESHISLVIVAVVVRRRGAPRGAWGGVLKGNGTHSHVTQVKRPHLFALLRAAAPPDRPLDASVDTRRDACALGVISCRPDPGNRNTLPRRRTPGATSR
jgi:hypothetical protein